LGSSQEGFPSLRLQRDSQPWTFQREGAHVSPPSSRDDATTLSFLPLLTFPFSDCSLSLLTIMMNVGMSTPYTTYVLMVQLLRESFSSRSSSSPLPFLVPLLLRPKASESRSSFVTFFSSTADFKKIRADPKKSAQMRLTNQLLSLSLAGPLRAPPPFPPPSTISSPSPSPHSNAISPRLALSLGLIGPSNSSNR